MSDRWKRSKHVLRSGHVLQFGRRRTAACAARLELDADIPEAWHIARVITPEGQVMGFGLHREPGPAKVAALYSAGLLKPVPTKMHAVRNEESMRDMLRGLTWR